MLAKIGVATVIAVFAAAMIGGVGLAIVPKAAFLAAPVLCPNGQMTTESETYRPAPGTTIVSRMWYCTDASGTRRELPTILPPLVCMTFVFIPVFFLILISSRSEPGTTSAEIPASMPRTVPTKGAAAGTLDGRLAELARARDAGLITEEEFEHKKKEMLDEF